MPDLPGGLLPVFVLDDYEGLQAKLLQDFTQAELDAYVDANAAALRELFPADVVFANHVLLGGAVGAASGAPFAVAAHGSELEYSMRGNERLSQWAAEVLAGARAVYVGSEHIRKVVEDVVGDVDNVHRGTARRRHRRLRARAARHVARRADRRVAARPGRRRRASSRRRATPSASRSSSPTTRRRFSTSAS